MRGGGWLTAERIAGYCRIAVSLYACVFIYAFLTAHGPIDSTGKPLGTDFSQIWVAGHSVLAADPAAPYDPARNIAAQHRLLGNFAGVYLWFYPPFFFAVAGLFAWLPYVPALLAWQLSTLVFYAWVMQRILPGRAALLACLAFPGVFINLGFGQNGFLSAGLFGGALVLLQRRPGLAGMVFALLAYKPQFGVLVPIALAAAGQWRAMAAALAMLAAMTGASVALFGTAPWFAFFGALHLSSQVMLTNGRTIWPLMQSPFAAAQLWGAGAAAAYTIQFLTAIFVIGLLARLWRGSGDWRAKGAALLSGALLATPYCLAYDLMLLAPALALLISMGQQHGFLPWEKTLLAAASVSPLLAGFALAHLLLPVGLVASGLVFFLSWQRSASGATSAPPGFPARIPPPAPVPGG